mgnify:CR=1 FL=1
MEINTYTIEKYLQDKVDINEITESDRDFILKAIAHIENKKNFREEHKYYIDRILSIYCIDYLNKENVKRTDEEIFSNIKDGITKDKMWELKIVLDILFFENVLKRKSSVYSHFHYLNDAVINSLNKSEEDIKKIAIIRAENIFTTYNNYHNEAINQIETTLKSVFGFEIINNDNLLNFEMGGCNYNVYLSRGYICLETDSIWHASSIEMLIDKIIKKKEN